MTRKMRKEERDPVTEEIIAACYRIYNELGPGFTEKIYSKALQIALEKTDLKYETEKDFFVSFDSIKVGKFRADFVIADSVIVELKSVEGKLPKIFESQVISYLKASGLQVGLLVNFGNRRCEIQRLMV